MGKGRAVYGLIKEENDKSLFRVDLWTTGTTWATPSCLFFSKAPWWNHIPKNKACSKVTADRKYKLDLSLTRAGRLTSYKFRLSISVQFRANQSKWTAWHKLLLAVMLSEPNYLHWVNEHQFWGGSLRLRNAPASWRKKKKERPLFSVQPAISQLLTTLTQACTLSLRRLKRSVLESHPPARD